MVRGSFVPTTNIWDVQSITETDFNSREFKELLVRMYQNINLISLILNTKDTGTYDIDEFVTGQQYPPDFSLPSDITKTNRAVIRKLINFGSLPAAGSKSVAHNIFIDTPTRFVHIYGWSATPSTSFIPLPFSSPTLNENIKLEVNFTDVVVTVGKDYSAYTDTMIVLEYIQ